MGHIQYYLQYKHLPVKFRRGANPGIYSPEVRVSWCEVLHPWLLNLVVGCPAKVMGMPKFNSVRFWFVFLMAYILICFSTFLQMPEC